MTEIGFEVRIIYAAEVQMEGKRLHTIEALNSEDRITMELFGQEREVRVFSVGDNQYDEGGMYKGDGFALSNEEITCLNWFLRNVRIDDYQQEIVRYCNKLYGGIGGKQIKEADIENELDMDSISIAINITEMTQAEDGFVYPEISFCGECACDPEHGICIGFRDKKFLGIHTQDWTL